MRLIHQGLLLIVQQGLEVPNPDIRELLGHGHLQHLILHILLYYEPFNLPRDKLPLFYLVLLLPLLSVYFDLQLLSGLLLLFFELKPIGS